MPDVTDGDEPRPEDTEVTCAGGITIPPIGVTNGE